MSRPRLSSFTIIGVILVAIGIYGLIPGTHFAFDPGIPAEPGEGYYYILVGVLMIVNGCFWMKPLPSESGKSEDKSQEPERTPVAPISPAAKNGKQ